MNLAPTLYATTFNTLKIAVSGAILLRLPTYAIASLRKTKLGIISSSNISGLRIKAKLSYPLSNILTYNNSRPFRNLTTNRVTALGVNKTVGIGVFKAVRYTYFLPTISIINTARPFRNLTTNRVTTLGVNKIVSLSAVKIISKAVFSIATNIVNTFIKPNTNIRKGLLRPTNFVTLINKSKAGYSVSSAVLKLFIRPTFIRDYSTAIKGKLLVAEFNTSKLKPKALGYIINPTVVTNLKIAVILMLTTVFTLKTKLLADSIDAYKIVNKYLGQDLVVLKNNVYSLRLLNLLYPLKLGSKLQHIINFARFKIKYDGVAGSVLTSRLNLTVLYKTVTYRKTIATYTFTAPGVGIGSGAGKGQSLFVFWN
jgi:hypothetical protein